MRTCSVMVSPCLRLTRALATVAAGPESTTSTTKFVVWLSGGEPLSVTTTPNE